MTKQVSFFKDLTNVSSDLNLNDILDQIQAGVYQTEIDEIGSLISQGKSEEAGKAKKRLPALLPVELFQGRGISLL